MNTDVKYQKLVKKINSYQKVIIAFSGGVDSTFLTWVVAKESDVIYKVVIGDSPSLPREQLNSARKFLNKNDIEFEVVATSEMQNENYTSNPNNRCYFCKSILFSAIQKIAESKNYVILDGSNYDDLQDFRPGRQAGVEANVHSPLAELQITKLEIREKSRELNLPTWNNPSSPCLASRIPYGQDVTTKKLSQIEEAESILKKLEFRECRVRNHENGLLARIEIAQDKFSLLDIKKINKINQELKKIGFKYVTFDLGGFKSGSLN